MAGFFRGGGAVLRFRSNFKENTVVGDYINTMKLTYDFNFDLYQAFKQHRYTKNGNKEKM